jgi:hypothetical protein
LKVKRLISWSESDTFTPPKALIRALFAIVRKEKLFCALEENAHIMIKVM